MTFLTTATINWFDDGCCDVKYLDLWEDAPVSYQPGQGGGPGWHKDFYEEIITHDGNGRLFHKAADLLMRYRIYPQNVLSHFGDFDLGPGRWLSVGDRIIQRIHVARIFGRPFLDILGLTEISRVTSAPRFYGFTSVTCTPHVEQGEWSASVEWRDNGDLALVFESVSRPSPQEPTRNHNFIRALHKKIQKAGLTHFKQAVLADTRVAIS